MRYKISYGAAGFGEATAYTLVSTFLLFYLTTIAGIAPAVAGLIVALGGIWDILTCPVFGYLSDNCSSAMGKRRPFLIAGCIPFTLFTMLLFTFIEATVPVRIAYYLIVIFVFWTAYSCYYIPYMALGAELTDDYDERTALRAYTSVFNSLGAIIGTVTPTILVEHMCSEGISLHLSWQFTALLIGLISGAAIFLCFIGVKGKDKPLPKEEKTRFNVGQMLRDYAYVLKIRPLHYLLATSVISLTGITMFNSGRMYFLTYNMGFSPKQISFTLFMACIIGMVMPPIINFSTKFFDRRTIFISFMIIGSVGSFLFKFIGITGYISLYLMITLYAILNMSYWQLMPTTLYDVGEYDRYTTGKDRVGAIMSIQSLAEALAEALGVQLLGILLQLVGFNGDAAVQTPFVLSWIESSMLVIPPILVVISCIFLWKYPITRKVYENIKAELAKREGESE
ncbi:MAG: MFS transporter [Clostridia bacterium]|nr:MFS transporter [Clostridia bacterium]